jgi:hypothetical protein
MSPRFESISSHRRGQSHKKTRQPCQNEPNGSATGALANQDHRPCGQAMTTVIQFSQPRPVFLSERGYGTSRYNMKIGSILLGSRERDKSTR